MKCQATLFLNVHISPMWTFFGFAGTRPCPLTYNKTCLEQAGQSTVGERSYHFETKDRDKGNERNIGPETYKHSHTAQLDGGLFQSMGTSTRPAGDQGSVSQQGGELSYIPEWV